MTAIDQYPKTRDISRFDIVVYIRSRLRVRKWRRKWCEQNNGASFSVRALSFVTFPVNARRKSCFYSHRISFCLLFLLISKEQFVFCYMKKWLNQENRNLQRRHSRLHTIRYTDSSLDRGASLNRFFVATLSRRWIIHPCYACHCDQTIMVESPQRIWMKFTGHNNDSDLISLAAVKVIFA